MSKPKVILSEEEAVKFINTSIEELPQNQSFLITLPTNNGRIVVRANIDSEQALLFIGHLVAEFKFNPSDILKVAERSSYYKFPKTDKHG